LDLGRSSLMPVDQVGDLMRKKLAEFRRVDRSGTGAPVIAQEKVARKQRRPAGKR
jgi:hypothetical protein